MIWREKSIPSGIRPAPGMECGQYIQLGSVLFPHRLLLDGGWTSVVSTTLLMLPQRFDSTDSKKQHEHKCKVDTQTVQIRISLHFMYVGILK